MRDAPLMVSTDLGNGSGVAGAFRSATGKHGPDFAALARARAANLRDLLAGLEIVPAIADDEGEGGDDREAPDLAALHAARLLSGMVDAR